jgi:uncharacterized membrane protein YdjX (TVP38/TMEM64 family)
VWKTESGREAMQRFWGRVRLGAVLPYIVAAALLVGATVIFGREVVRHINAIEGWIEGFGPWGMVVFVALFAVLSSLLMPETVLGIVSGALFGLGGGTIALVSGILFAASLQYFLSRHILRGRIESMLTSRPTLLAIQRAARSQEFRLQVLLRLTPLNPAVISYVLGAAGVRFGGFFTACLALIPHALLEVYFGHAGKQMAKMAAADGRSDLINGAVIVGGLAAGILVMVLVSRSARKALQQAVS